MAATGADLPERVETKRLILRPTVLADLPAFMPLIGDWRVSRWLPRVPHPYTEADGRDWVALTEAGRRDGIDLNFSIEERLSGQVIGGIGLVIDNGVLGYWIGEPYWGRRFATEAVGAMVHCGFVDLRLKRIQAHVHPDNIGSQRVLVAAGLLLEGIVQHDYLERGRIGPAYQYALNRDPFAGHQ